MKRRSKIRAAALLSAVLLVLCGLWTDARLSLNDARTRLEYSYRRALYDLTDHVSSMKTALEKAPYVNTSAMQALLSAELLEESSGAKAAMAVLPLPQEKTEVLSRFLSQTGDYALSLCRHSAAAQEDSLEALSRLEQYAGKLFDALQSAQAKLTTENLSLGRTESLLANLETDALPRLDDDFDTVAEEFAQFPALLYDGPFSDHISRRTPLFLEGKEEITGEEAARIAAEFLRCSPEELEAVESGSSQLPVFSFTREDSHVNITKQGGEIAYFKKSGAVSSARLSYEDALSSARDTLRDMGIDRFRETYYVKNDNLCTINFSAFATTENQNVVCYPDLIKVVIELEQGGMVEYDCTGYLMNHRERKLSLPGISQEQAAESVSPLLTQKSCTVAVIPTPGLSEVLCWEFLCTNDEEREFLVYINGETGEEEQLYLLQKDDHGTLVF